MTRSCNSLYFFLALLILFLSSCNNRDKNTLEKLLAVKSDTLEIDNTKDTLLIGSKGTALFFEKGSFVLPDGTTPKGKINILLKECYSMADIIRENLSTAANDQLLETKGMINVKAFAGDQELSLKKDKKFIVHFPKDSIDRNKPMNLFYGQKRPDGNVNWQLDSLTLLKPRAHLSGYSSIGWPAGDSTGHNLIYLKGHKNDWDIYDYFDKNFDQSRLKLSTDQIDKTFEARFFVTSKGKIKHIEVKESRLDSTGKQLPPTVKPDPYFYEFVQHIPTLEPYCDTEDNLPFDSDCSFYFDISAYPPEYRNNENYNQLFNQKYAAFKNNTIQSMNDAELKYYIFSASKLGWINCDFFWKTADEKIDYIVSVDPQSKPDIRLIFKQAKSIMAGKLEENKYIFKNVPVNQDIKIVALSFKGNKPLMAIAETKTSKTSFDKLDYREFTIDDLEKQLNTP